MTLPTPIRRPSTTHKTTRVFRLERLEDRTVPSASLGLEVESILADPTTFEPNTILVRFDRLDPTQQAPAVLPNTQLGTSLGLVDGLFRIHLSDDISVEEALEAYRSLPGVLEVSPDYLLTIATIPNDPRFDEQWGLENTGQTGGSTDADIDSATAWSRQTASRVPIAVMDTGIDYLHEDLYQNIWINQGEIPDSRVANLTDIDGDGLLTFLDLNHSSNQGSGKITDLNGNGVIDADDLLAPMILSGGSDTGSGGWADGSSTDGNSYIDDIIGWNFADNSNRPLDDNGHGTHVAGILGAMGGNGIGVTGVAWQAQLVSLKWIGASGSGSIGHYVQALQYAVDQGIPISNNSWSGTSNSSFLFNALDSAREAGHILVMAAGNGQQNLDSSPVYPASFDLDNIVAVAATNDSDGLATFSNYGANSVDIGAPGVGILSTRPGNQYLLSSGTSMATPFVAGTVALVWSENPSWTYHQVIDHVLDSVDPLPGLQNKTSSGGRLNAGRALTGSTIEVDTTPPVVQSSSVHGSSSSPGTLNRVRLNFSEPIDSTTLNEESITLTGPSGTAIEILSITPVSGSNDSKFDVKFLTQSANGTYQFRLDPDVRDLAGNQMTSAYTRTFSIEAAAETHTVTSTRRLQLLDKKKIATTVAVNENMIIEEIKVQVDITHTYDGDLLIYLQGPDGTEIILSNRRGKSGDGYDGTIFSDFADIDIRHGTAPFVGEYRPDRALSAFHDQNARGVWILWIEDRANGDTGHLEQWSLIVTPQAGSTATTASIQELAPLGNEALFSTQSVGSATGHRSSLGTLPIPLSTMPNVERFSQTVATQGATLPNTSDSLRALSLVMSPDEPEVVEVDSAQIDDEPEARVEPEKEPRSIFARIRRKLSSLVFGSSREANEELLDVADNTEVVEEDS